MKREDAFRSTRLRWANEHPVVYALTASTLVALVGFGLFRTWVAIPIWFVISTLAYALLLQKGGPFRPLEGDDRDGA